MCLSRKKKNKENAISILNARKIKTVRRIDSLLKVWEPGYLFGMEYNTEEVNSYIKKTNQDTIEKMRFAYQEMKFADCALADSVVLDKIEKELDVIDKYYRNEASLTIINDSANDIWKCVQSWANR